MLAVALAGAEALRAHALTGFPWAMPGHVWIGWAPMQLAAWGGAHGLTLATLLLAALPAAVGLRAGGLAAAAGVAAMFAAGLWQGSRPLPPPGGAVVRLVQPDARQELKWDPAMLREYFRRQLAATAASPAAGGRAPDLVVWPETAVPFLLDDPGEGLALIATAAAGAPVALGIQRVEGWRAFNSLAVIGPDSEVRAVYDKHHLVPFGEYIPLGDLAGDLLGLTAFAAQAGNAYSAGPGPALIDLGPGLGRVLPLICYEAVFPQDIRRAPGRPDWMLQVTNDAWFGTLSGPWQHLGLARLRAVEFGLPLLRSANTGVSAVIDARGGVSASLGLHRQGHLDAALPAALPPTPYARLGEWPFAILLVLAAAAAVAAAPVRRAVDRTGPPR
jgi:apolipoprotein N-acyltransferase